MTDQDPRNVRAESHGDAVPERINGSVDESLARFAHGLTSSLMVIQSRVGLDAAKVDDEDLRRSLEETGLLIEDLRFSIEMRAATQSFRHPNVGAISPHVIHREVRQAAARCELRGMPLEARIVEASGFPVLADWHYLRLVIDEIVGNAGRYARSHRGCSLEVTWVVGDGEVAIQFADSGPGIQEEPATVVFEDGYRGEWARARQPSGLGRGLFVAREFCRSMKGDLRLVDGPRGATFEIVLPTP